MSAAFVTALEDVVAVYARPIDPRTPLVCFDEGGKELVAQVTPPLPAAPGRPAREDHAYLRNGAANLFLACAPYHGWRQVQVTTRRTAVDFARAVRDLVDRQFPDAERIVFVTDNLNTHTPAAFYQAFPAPEARRILARLEWHYTPVHGSWLNMAELELSALARQCLARRIPDRPTLAREVAAWVADRNRQPVRIAWRFGIAAARGKLAHCYPTPEPDNSAVSEYSAGRGDIGAGKRRTASLTRPARQQRGGETAAPYRPSHWRGGRRRVFAPGSTDDVLTQVVFYDLERHVQWTIRARDRFPEEPGP